MTDKGVQTVQYQNRQSTKRNDRVKSNEKKKQSGSSTTDLAKSKR